MNRFKKMFLDKSYRTLVLMNKGFYNFLSDEEYLKKRFKCIFGYDLNINNPKTFNEKLQWLKINYRNPQYPKLVDKYEVKSYVKEVLGEEYVIPTIGVWDNPNEIDFNVMPDRFVLKCTHNSGKGLCICQDKQKLDLKKVKRALKSGLKQNYFLTCREWPYKKVKRRIIAEEFKEDVNGDLPDYKFYCFNGKVEFVLIVNGRFKKNTTGTYFDRNFKKINLEWGFKMDDGYVEKPRRFEEMISCAEKLSKGMPHVRVDLYLCDDKIYFGEFTFFDGGGFEKMSPAMYDSKFGDLIDLNNI